MQFFFPQSSYFKLIFIFIYVAVEVFHHYWDLSWIWLTIGNSLGNQIYLIQWYKYLNCFYGSLWILLLGYYLNVKNYKKFVLLLLIPIVFSIILFRKEIQPSKVSKEFVIFNPKFDVYNSSNSFRFYYLVNKLNEKKLRNDEIVLVPEGYFSNCTLDTISKYFTKNLRDKCILFGMDVINIDSTLTNSLIYFNNNVCLKHDKTKYVPYAEFVPQYLEGVFHRTRFSEPKFDNTKEINTETGFLQLICYEALYSYIIKNDSYDLLVVLASENFIRKNSLGQKQYNNILQVRAIENQKYILKCSYTGDNLVISPNGTTLKHLNDEISRYSTN